MSRSIIMIFMDLLDWILVFGTAAAFGFAFGMLLPPHGWVAGVLVAGVMLFRAKKQRDKRIRQLQKHQEKR
ncbi:MAG: hypothetical protein GX933_07150 [Chloroflexi bacterium]|jgi:uncharacterized membrane protein AbrB (regulator of aidB expression)|nr:hypothetical protein [Chloroflexota bacterium]